MRKLPKQRNGRNKVPKTTENVSFSGFVPGQNFDVLQPRLIFEVFVSNSSGRQSAAQKISMIFKAIVNRVA